MRPEITLLFAHPILERATGVVVGWECRVHVAIGSAEGFDDFRFSVNSRHPLARWDAADLLRELKSPICRSMIEKLIGVVQFRAGYDVQQEFQLTQLKGFVNGNLTSSLLSLE